jgi:hypothetical protein
MGSGKGSISGQGPTSNLCYRNGSTFFTAATVQTSDGFVPLSAHFGVLTDVSLMLSPVDVSSKFRVSMSGFVRNRSTGNWVATMTVTNVTGAPVNGPIQTVITNLPPTITMLNRTGVRSGNPYITVTASALAPGASVSVSIQFSNPNNASINFVPVTFAGV